MKRRVEWVLLGLILAVGAWLRFSHLDLLQFQSDEAIVSHLAWQFVKGVALPTEGLTSSVGVANPPLFIYLLIPMYAVTSNPAAAMFAVSPWAVLYSRQIWAQDFLNGIFEGHNVGGSCVGAGAKTEGDFLGGVFHIVRDSDSFCRAGAGGAVILYWIGCRLGDWRFGVLCAMAFLVYDEAVMNFRWVRSHPLAVMVPRQSRSFLSSSLNAFFGCSAAAHRGQSGVAEDEPNHVSPHLSSLDNGLVATARCSMRKVAAGFKRVIALRLAGGCPTKRHAF